MRTRIRDLIFIILFALLLAIGASLHGHLVLISNAAEQSCVTAECHSSMLKSKDIHPVASACDSCHEATATPHPQQGRKTFRLIQEGGALCTMCHPDKQTYPVVHGPTAAGDCTACHNPHESNNRALTVKAGAELCAECHTDIGTELHKKIVHPPIQDGCTSCHNPHGSPYKKLLTEDGENLCFQCHPDVGDAIKEGKSVHPPVQMEKACASCHSPHASDNAKLLLKPEKELCLGCHNDLIKKTYTVLHEPVKEGKCTVCHNPHASPYAKLLVKSFPEDFYATYSDKEYDLCFSCHNRDIVRFPDTSFATGFRDGDRNLHYLHVRGKEKGRSCKACHDPHGGTVPKLLVDKVKFGKWELPLNYVKTENGGTCTPGCHKKYSYDRKVGGQQPEPGKP